MSVLALGLVLVAAVTHATWNLLARRADDKLPFLWCTTLVTSVLFLPLGLWLVLTRPVPPAGWVVVAVFAHDEGVIKRALERKAHGAGGSGDQPMAGSAERRTNGSAEHEQRQPGGDGQRAEDALDAVPFAQDHGSQQRGHHDRDLARG